MSESLDDLVFKQEQESRKVGKLMLSGYDHSREGYFRADNSNMGVYSGAIDADSYLKGLDKKIDGSFNGRVVPVRDTQNLLFKTSDRLGNTNDTRSRKSCNDIFNKNYNTKNRHYSLNVLNSDIQNHIQYDIGSDSRRFKRDE